MSGDPMDKAIAAAVAELHRQEETSGCTVQADGDWAQVDGSFDIRKVVEAVLSASKADSTASERPASSTAT